MKLRIIIEDTEGGILAERERKFDEAFEISMHDWNDEKAEMIAEVMEPTLEANFA